MYKNIILIHTNNGDIMNIKKYNIIADSFKPKENKLSNYILAFISGGLIGMFGEFIIYVLILYFHISRNIASTYMILIFIFLASMLTGFGVFDEMVKIFRCGFIIPITGFAHSMTSAIMDYKKEGFIFGFGSNVFKLAGSVLLYGVVTAFIVGFIRYLLGVIL